MEMTLGKIVDSFEPVEDKSCSTPAPVKSLEEEYQVSSVDTREEEGVKILEIPAGDYVPVSRPPVAPIITSITNARVGGGLKPRIEVSQEPIIDDIDEPDIDEPGSSFLDAFIEAQTREALAEPKEDEIAPQSTPEEYEPMRLSSAIAPELASQQERLLLDFPSLAELQSLAAQLLSLGNQQTPADDGGVGAASGPREERENSHSESNSIMDDEES
jgi:hypothetical protein